MVSINQYINQSSNTPVLNQSPIDQNSILNSGNKVAAAYESVLGQDIQSADQTRREANRAQMVETEAKHQQSLNLQSSYLKTNEILLSGITKIAAIDEAKRKEEESKTNAIYNLNSISKLNTDYIKFVQDAQSSMSPDGSGYTENVQKFFDTQIKQYADTAPTEQAKFDIYTKASQFKMQAISNALGVEQKARDVFRMGMLNDTADQLVNQTLLNPNNTDKYIENLNSMKSVLSLNGFNEEESKDFITNKTQAIRENQIDSLLHKGMGDQAEALIQTNDFVSSIDPKVYKKMENDIFRFQITKLGEDSKQTELLQSVDMFNKGLLPKGDPMFNKAADYTTSNLLFSQIPGRPTFSVNDIPQATGAISQFFVQHPNGMGAQTANRVNNTIVSGTNPFETVAYSLAINSLVKDNSGRALEVISSVDKDALTMANRISTLSNTGVPSQEAVTQARKEFEDSKNPALNEWVKSEVNAKGWIDNGVDDLMKKAIDGFLTWFPTDSGDTYKGNIRELYTSNLYKYKNVDIAKQATVGDIKKLYAVTDINGSNEVMEAAPNMFYDNDVISVFKKKMSEGKVQIAKDLGGVDNGDGSFNTANGRVQPVLRPIPNVTLNETDGKGSAIDKKTYLWYDSNTGLPIQNKEGRIAQFTFDSNSDTYLKKLEENATQLKKDREDIKKQHQMRIDAYYPKLTLSK